MTAKKNEPRDAGVEAEATSSAHPPPPRWWNTHLTAEEEAELGRESIRREGRISSEEMKAFIQSLSGYVPKSSA
jgi:hypothetical protein